MGRDLFSFFFRVSLFFLPPSSLDLPLLSAFGSVWGICFSFFFLFFCSFALSVFFVSLLRCFSFFCFLFFCFCYFASFLCFVVSLFFVSLLWFYTPSCLVQIQFFTYATFLFLVNTSHVFLNFTRSWWGNPNHTHISRSYPIICHFIDTQPLTKTRLKNRSMFLPRTFFPPNTALAWEFSPGVPRDHVHGSRWLCRSRGSFDAGAVPGRLGSSGMEVLAGVIFWRPKTIWP